MTGKKPALFRSPVSPDCLQKKPRGHFPVNAGLTRCIPIQCGACRRRYGVVPVDPGVHTVATSGLKTGTVWTRLQPCHTKVTSLQRSHRVEKEWRSPRCELQVLYYFIHFYQYKNESRGPKRPQIAHLRKRSRVTVNPFTEDHWCCLSNIGRGPLDDAIYQIWKLKPCSFRQKDIENYILKTFVLPRDLLMQPIRTIWTILVWDHTGTIPVDFGQIPISGSRK